LAVGDSEVIQIGMWIDTDKSAYVKFSHSKSLRFPPSDGHMGSNCWKQAFSLTDPSGV